MYMHMHDRHMFICCSTCFFLEMINLLLLFCSLSDVENVTREIVGSLRGWTLQHPTTSTWWMCWFTRKLIKLFVVGSKIYNVSVCHPYFRCVNFENLPRLSQILVKRTMTKNRRTSTRHVHLPGSTQLTQRFVWGGKFVCHVVKRHGGHGEVIAKVDSGGPLIYKERALTCSNYVRLEYHWTIVALCARHETDPESDRSWW